MVIIRKGGTVLLEFSRQIIIAAEIVFNLINSSHAAQVEFMTNRPHPESDCIAKEAASAELSSADAGQSDAEVRAATISDLPQITLLIEKYVNANRLLPRTRSELQDLIPTGFVALWKNQLVGFAALEIYSSKLGEVRSLAVRSEAQGLGLGKRLVEQCIQLAKERDVLEVMAVTSNELFFQSCGFDFTLPGEKKALFVQTRDDIDFPRDADRPHS